MSVPITAPSGPTWSASQAATDPLPAPSSRHRQPGPTPVRVRGPKVSVSNAASSASERAVVSSRSLVSRYSGSLTGAPYASAGEAHPAVDAQHLAGRVRPAHQVEVRLGGLVRCPGTRHRLASRHRGDPLR